MNFIRLDNNRYMIAGSNNYVISKEEMQRLTQEAKRNDRKPENNDRRIEDVEHISIEETTTSAKSNISKKHN